MAADAKEKVVAKPPELKIDNEGDIYSPNRAARRRKPMRPRSVTEFGYVDVPSNAYTKSTHKIKKERAKHARTKQQRQTAIAKARKARKASYTQVS